MERSVTLEPVQNWYNVTFDVAFWMVMYLFVRGAFQDIHVSLFSFFFFTRANLADVLLQTKEDLITNKRFQLQFKEEFKDQPL